MMRSCFYYNHDNSAQAIEKFFRGKNYARLASVPDLKSNNCYIIDTEHGESSISIDAECVLVCFIHDTPNQARWIKLAEGHQERVTIVFISRNGCERNDTFPRNVLAWSCATNDLHTMADDFATYISRILK